MVGGTPASQTKEPIPIAEPEKDIPAAVPETVHVVPETVKQLCRDRIWSIIQRVKELHQTIEEIEKEKLELQEFLGASE